MNKYASNKLLAVSVAILASCEANELVTSSAEAGGLRMNNTNLTQLCKSVGFSEALTSTISDKQRFVAFLRPWRREKLYWENLDTQNESRLLSHSKSQWLKELVKQVPEFKATLECVLQTYQESDDPDFFRALVLRRMEKNKNELSLRSEMLKDFLDSKNSSLGQKKIQRAAGKMSASTKASARPELVLDPPGLQLLISEEDWDSIKEEFTARLLSAGGKIAQEQVLLAKWEFADEKTAKLKQQELGSSARLIRVNAESQRVNPCLPSNHGVASRLLPVLVKAPIGSVFAKSTEPGVYTMKTPERYMVEQQYRLVDIESESSKGK